jgi:hypothetical protein
LWRRTIPHWNDEALARADLRHGPGCPMITEMKYLPATAALVGLACGCTSVGSSAVRTGGVEMPPYAGPVAIYAAGVPREGAELGVVEVHATQQEAVVEELVPLFVKRVAGLGGNAAVIDSVRARFDIVAHPFVTTYSYPCGYHTVCLANQVSATNDEVMSVTIRGRAFSVPGGAR